MPELPEVETTRCGILPHIKNNIVSKVVIRQAQLRWPVPSIIKQALKKQTIVDVQRRGKYLLLTCQNGCLIIHLGMSGSLRIVDNKIAAEKHDHVDIVFADNKSLRLRDPRRFGAVLWTKTDPLKHKLLKSLGPEPLSDEFNANYLYTVTRKRKQAIKTFIMDSHIVVGVGNIYASEALFKARIRPTTTAGRVSRVRLARLVDAIKITLQAAIKHGGTTLRDFTASDGKPGYFQQQLQVYNRGAMPCLICSTDIKLIKLGQRATYFCPHCQR